MRIRVRLYGILKTAANSEAFDLEFGKGATIRELVVKIVGTVARPEFENYLIDSDLKDPRPNALILVSGTEIGALNGLDTMLQDGDEVVFLPVAHGGSSHIWYLSPAVPTLYINGFSASTEPHGSR